MNEEGPTLTDDRPHGAIAAALDAREAVQSKHALADRASRLYSVTAALSGALTPESVADVVIRQGVAALGASAGLLALRADSGDALEIVRGVGYPPAQIAAWQNFPIATRLPLSDVVRTGRPLFLPTPAAFAARYPELGEHVAQSTYRAWASIPLVAGDGPVGALGLSFLAERDFTADDRDFIAALAEQCAQALERARLYDAERRARADVEAANARLALLAQAGALLAGSLDHERALQALAQLAVSSFADWCVAQVEDVGGSRDVIVVAHHDSGMAEWARRMERLYATDDEAPLHPARVIREGRAILVSDIDAAELASDAGSDGGAARLVKDGAPRSAIAVPFTARKRVAGGLVFVSATADRYTAADLALAEEFARRAGAAVESAWLYRDAQEGRQIGEDVLAMAAHDLRNPLSAIGLNVQLLRSETTHEGVERSLDAMQRSVNQMDRLIRDLLDMARLKGGHLTLERSVCACDALVGDALDVLRPILEQKRQRVETDVACGTACVVCDRERVGQILSNILGNAVRFTPDGGLIQVRAAVRGAEVVFAVRDSGPGIPPEDLDRIFDRYWQAEGAMRKGGLGLYIAKELVVAHGGRIWAESEPEMGCTFYFTLPAADRADRPVETSLGDDER